MVQELRDQISTINSASGDAQSQLETLTSENTKLKEQITNLETQNKKLEDQCENDMKVKNSTLTPHPLSIYYQST